MIGSDNSMKQFMNFRQKRPIRCAKFNFFLNFIVSSRVILFAIRFGLGTYASHHGKTHPFCKQHNRKAIGSVSEHEQTLKPSSSIEHVCQAILK